jgi:glycosyltransferase involved in cell wall biosynthesis
MQTVSVVIPAFNGAAFIGDTIEAVFAQTHSAWELIVVDDGSTDDTESIVQSFMQRSPEKIRLLSHPAKQNRGIFPTRLLGMQHARGDVLAPVDQDDLWDPDYLGNQLRMWNTTPGIGICFGPALWWHPEDSSLDYVGDAPVPGLYAPGTLLAEFLHSGWDRSPTTVGVALIRPDAIQGLERYAKRLARAVHEDQFLWFFITARWPALVHDRALMRYRVHPNQRTSAMSFRARKRSLADFYHCVSEDLRDAQPTHSLMTSGELGERARVARREVSVRYRIRRKVAKALGRP